MQCQQETKRRREVENQMVVGTARKRTSINAIQQGALANQLSGMANCEREEQERKFFTKAHTLDAAQLGIFGLVD